MKFLWFMLFSVIAVLIKENFCVPAIRPLSQRGIIFPVENWDNCYLDDASSRPGLCKKLEECPDILKKWDQENVYPKTCYFIKKQQFVCCPIPANADVFTSTEKLDYVLNKIATTTATKKPDNILDIFNTGSDISTRPSNIFLDQIGNKTTITDKTTTTMFTKRPSNIFLDQIGNNTTITVKPSSNFPDKTTTMFTKRPSNIFLDQVGNKTTITAKPSNIFLDKTTTPTKRPSNIFLDNFNTQKTTSKNPLPFEIFTTKPFIKRRSETECDIQTAQQSESSDKNEPFSEPNEFPFMAVLGSRSEADNKVWYSCGGVLISSTFVLTAAHCASIGGVKPSFVHLGDKNLTDSEKGTIKIKQFIMHPSYKDTDIHNDIALVELDQEVEHAVACLWALPDLPIAEFIALDYGHITFEAINSNQLLKTNLTPIDNAECQQIYKLYDNLRSIAIDDSHLCAGDIENFRHFCQGDTGGPLIVKLETVSYVIGITTFGLGCADLPPSIFTRVSSFIDWIEPIVWPEIDVRIDNK